MKLKIIDTNFKNDADWLFKLADQEGVIYYILENDFYRQLKIKTPVTKKHLDYYDKGTTIEAETKENGSRKIVIDILE